MYLSSSTGWSTRSARTPARCLASRKRAGAQDCVFAELARVLVPRAVLVAADGTFNEATAAFHEGDTYNPIDPGDLEVRLRAAGFGDVEVRTYEPGWVCTARAG